MIATHSFTALEKDDVKPARKANPAFNRLVHAYANRAKLPMLSREHELELVNLVQNQGCADSMSALVEHHMGYIVKMANACASYNNLKDHIDDLYNEAIEGFMRAVMKFTPERHARLSSYVKYYISANCYRYAMDMKHIFRVGTNLPAKKAFYHMPRIRNLFYSIYNRPMTNSFEDALKGEMISGIPAKAIKNQMDIEFSAHPYSSDEIQIYDSHEKRRPEDDIFNESGMKCIQRHIQAVADKLSKRDHDIFLAVISDPYNKTEVSQLVADQHNITVERVRQIVRGALRDVRNSLAEAGIKNISDVA